MTRRRVFGWALVGLAVWVVLGLLGAFRVGPLVSLGMTMLVVTALAATYELVRQLPTNPVLWRGQALTVAGPREDAPDFRLRTLRSDVADSLTHGERLHATLVLLADERLADRRHVDRTQDPAAATALLGQDLAAYLGATTGHRISHATLSDYISRIEAL